MMYAASSGEVAVKDESLAAPTRNSVEASGELEEERDSLAQEAPRSSHRFLWLCYAKPLAERQKSNISGSWLSPMPSPKERSS